jgi:hypothetical protein
MYFVKTTPFLKGRVGLGWDSPIKYVYRPTKPYHPTHSDVGKYNFV